MSTICTVTSRAWRTEMLSSLVNCSVDNVQSEIGVSDHRPTLLNCKAFSLLRTVNEQKEKC